MAQVRDRPYPATGFTVDIGVELACSEVELPELQEVIVEYRAGDDKRGARLLPVQPRLGELVLRRGFDGDLALYSWWRTVADGTRDERNVVVTVLDESRVAVARIELRGALPSTYRLGPLNADASAGGVLVESLAARVADVVIE
jgi:phage tail-like protein